MIHGISALLITSYSQVMCKSNAGNTDNSLSPGKPGVKPIQVTFTLR